MTKRRAQGVAFVAVLVTLLVLAVGSYAGAFRDGVPVTLRVERAGSQLNERADVKIRGLVVGKVATISTESATNGATVELMLDPELVDQIPAEVSARLVPKTLFGEKYVELEYPPGVEPAAVARPIAAGAVIPMDRSQEARELERALDGLLPLLQTVEPKDLATTLGALSLALEGRGAQLGETLVRLHGLLEEFNPALPDLQADITELADVAANVDSAAPDLLDAVEDFTVTSRTVVEQRADLRALLTGLTTASDDVAEFLDRNGDNLVDLAAASRPTLDSLARYAPEFPCLFSQIAGIIPEANRAFGADDGLPGIHITLEITNSRGPYVPGDEPQYEDDRGPRCYPIIIPAPQYPPDGPFQDGSSHPPPPGTSGSSTYKGMSAANSPGEQQLVAELTAARNGGPPDAVPGWSTLLVGPLYRTNEGGAA